MHCGILTTDGRGMIAFVDETALSLLERTLSDLVGKHWTVILDSIRVPYREEIVYAMRGIQIAHESESSSIRGVCRLAARKSAISWAISRLEGVSPQREIAILFFEEAHREPVKPSGHVFASYKDTFDHAVEGIFRTTLEGHYIEVNPALARLYGYDSPQALITAMGDLNTQLYVKPGRRAEFVETIRKRGYVIDFEAEVYRADGSVVWISEFARTVCDAQGRPMFYEGSVIDVTLKKKAEAALRESEEKFRMLVENANVLPWEADIDTWRFTYVGPQAVHLLGYSAEDWLQPGFWERVVHEDDRPWVSTVRAEAIKNRRSFECEYRMVGLDGRIVWVRDVLSVIDLSHTQILGGFTFDITYRRFTEQALRDKPHFVEHIASATPAIIYLYDLPTQECLFVSGRVDRILGYTPHALWDMKPFFILALGHASEHAGHLAHFENLAQLSLGQSLEREFRLRSVHGDWLWLRSREAVYVRNASGKPQQILGVALDVTAQRLAHEELASNEALFRSLTETTRVIPFEMDLDTGRFTYVGPQAEALLGYPVQIWFRREGWLSLIHPEDGEIALQFMYPPPTHPGPETDFQAEFRLRAIDGRVLWFRELVRYARGEDQRLRVRGFLFDITEAKIHEQELRRARDRLRELALRDQTVREDERANVAREIHDELGQALTMFRIDLDWMENRLGKSAVLDLDSLEEKIFQMKKMVDGTLHTVRRIISNLRPAVLDELGLKAAIEWQAQEFSRRAGIRCMVKCSTIDENVGNEVSIAAFRILQELLTNVLRHAHASRVDIEINCNAPYLKLTVRDNGRGFIPGDTGPSGGKKSFGLLGMRERASALGGQVDISSENGKGTIVSVALPLDVKLP